jgi:hypothetical protein
VGAFLKRGKVLFIIGVCLVLGAGALFFWQRKKPRDALAIMLKEKQQRLELMKRNEEMGRQRNPPLPPRPPGK